VRLVHQTDGILGACPLWGMSVGVRECVLLWYGRSAILRNWVIRNVRHGHEMQPALGSDDTDRGRLPRLAAHLEAHIPPSRPSFKLPHVSRKQLQPVRDKVNISGRLDAVRI
jgi:hypothetical protein